MALQDEIKKRLRDGQEGMFTVCCHRKGNRLYVDELHTECIDGEWE